MTVLATKSKQISGNCSQINNFQTRSNSDLAKSALNFSKGVHDENLRVIVHERARMNYLDIQMIFEADDHESVHFDSYTSYSTKLHPNNSKESNYDSF